MKLKIFFAIFFCCLPYSNKLIGSIPKNKNIKIENTEFNFYSNNGIPWFFPSANINELNIYINYLRRITYTCNRFLQNYNKNLFIIMEPKIEKNTKYSNNFSLKEKYKEIINKTEHVESITNVFTGLYSLNKMIQRHNIILNKLNKKTGFVKYKSLKPCINVESIKQQYKHIVYLINSIGDETKELYSQLQTQNNIRF